MGQYEILEFFTKKYWDNENETYTIGEVAKAVKSPYSVVHKKIARLWFYGYLVREKKPTRNKKVFYYNGGYSYKLNYACRNTMRLLFKIDSDSCVYSDISKEKLPNIRDKLEQKENNGAKGGFFYD